MQTIKKLSEATERFLRPIPKEKLGDAILAIDFVSHSSGDKFILEVYEQDEFGNKNTPYSIAACQFITSRFKHGHKQTSRKGTYHPIYEVPVTDYSVFLIQEAWTGKKLISPLASQKMAAIMFREITAETNALRTSLYKDNKTLRFSSRAEAVLTNQETGEEIKLATYQKVAAENSFSASDGYGLFMDPGTGKTAIALAKVDQITEKVNRVYNRPARILILAPKNVRFNWQREIQHFTTLKHKSTILKGGSLLERTGCLLSGLAYHNDDPQPNSTTIIAGYEAAVGTETITAVEWDLVIADESHLISNPSTQRTKFCVNELRDKSSFRMILTGTPIRNSPFDLYSQLEFLGKGYSGFDSFNAFKTFFGQWKDIPGKGIRVLEQFQNIPLLQERLAKHTFIIREEEALPNLPDIVFDVIECSLTHEQYKVYRQLATFLQAEIDATSFASMTGDRVAMTVNNILTKMLRLAQVTSGFAATDEDGLYRFDPNPKLETLVESVKEHLDLHPTSKVQIWANWVENIKQISYRFNEIEKIPGVTFYGSTKDDERLEAERKFNCDPETKLFIGNPAAGGVGLNLLGFDPYNPSQYETNCDRVLYFSQGWSSVNRRQSIKRAHRRGCRVPVRVSDLIVPGSIDEEITRRVAAKIEMALSVSDVKNIMVNILKGQVSVNGDA